MARMHGSLALNLRASLWTYALCTYAVFPRVVMFPMLCRRDLYHSWPLPRRCQSGLLWHAFTAHEEDERICECLPHCTALLCLAFVRMCLQMQAWLETRS